MLPLTYLTSFNALGTVWLTPSCKETTRERLLADNVEMNPAGEKPLRGWLGVGETDSSLVNDWDNGSLCPLAKLHLRQRKGLLFP